MKVVLIGFAASYKTTAGKILAEKLGCDFFDVDDEVERLTGKKVSQIFADNGEGFFRGKENEALRELADRSGVIACGGGSVLLPNFQTLAQGSTVVWLKASAREIRNRLSFGTRPLFDGLTEEELARFVAEREEIYGQFAQITVQTDGKTPRQAVEAVFDKLKLN